MTFKKVSNKLIAEMFGYATHNGWIAYYRLQGGYRPMFSWERVKTPTKWFANKPKMTERMTSISRKWRVRRKGDGNYTDIPKYLKNDKLVRCLQKRVPVKVLWDYKKQSYLGTYEHESEAGAISVHCFVAPTFNEAFFGALVVAHKDLGLTFKEKV